jgi:anti-sigma regulatory factor (Ser/Thr protein kinase)
VISLAITEQSAIAAARRLATGDAQRIGFNETATGRIALVATELATNVLHHGGGGELLIGPYEDGGPPGIEILALDEGKGMADVARCLQDGYSTAGTAGTGLGAVLRQSDLVDIVSQPNAGTAILARFSPRPTRSAPFFVPPVVWGAVAVPAPGEAVSGDAWVVDPTETGADVLVVDGLGHGADAAKAAQATVAIFQDFHHLSPGLLMERMHAGIAATRGAAAAIARLDFNAGHLIFAGIGNIAGTILSGGRTRKTVSHNGILGHAMRQVQTFEYPLEEDSLVLFHTDGLQSNWNLDRYPGLAARHPSLIAGILYRDFRRGRDDVTVLAIKRRAS